MRALWTGSILLTVAVLLCGTVTAGEIENLQKKFSAEGDLKARVKAGVDLAMKDPEVYAAALEEIVKANRPDDLAVLAKTSVQLKPRHLRLLTVNAASKWGDPAIGAFLARIDNDYPKESVRATAALGWLKATSAWERLVELLRNEDEMIAVQAARALARIGTRKQAAALAEASLNVDNRHVRLHVIWAVQDMVGNRKTAIATFGRYRSRKGTIGLRAKEAQDMIVDEMTPAEKYKTGLETVETFFGKRGGPKRFKMKASKEHRDRINKALDAMKEKAPAWYHLLCTSIDVLEVSSAEWKIDAKRGAVNIRYSEIAKWPADLRYEDYYLVRYATILFLAKMGDPSEMHRGWEEGMIDAWYYAWDHTNIAVEEKLVEFVQKFLQNPPW